MFDKIVSLGPGYAGRLRSGELVLSLVDGVEQLETYFGQYLPQLLISIFTPIIIFVFVAFLDFPVALILLAAAFVSLFAPSTWHKFDRKRSKERQNAYEAFASDFLDGIQGLATLKSFGQSKTRADLLTKRAYELFRSTMWVLATNVLSRGITDTSIALGAATALGYGAYRTTTGEMELTTLLIILMMGVEIFRPMRDLRTVLHQGMMGLSAAHGVFKILDASPAVIEKKFENIETVLEPSVSFDSVKFKYPGHSHVVHSSLSFNIKKGERVGIVGSSGCGKSSIVKLLLRFHDPVQGSVHIGGIDLRDISFDQIRGMISVGHQDTFLIHGAGGGVGTAAIQLAKTKNIKIIGTSSSWKHDKITQMGVDKCIDYNKSNIEKEIMDFTNGKGVDLIIDPVGTKNWKISYKVLSNMGKLIIYGDQILVKGDKLKPMVALKEMYSMPKYKPMDLMANNKAVMGYHLGRFKGHEWKVKRSIDNLIKLVEEYDLHPVVDSKFSYQDAAKAHRYIQDRKNFCKVLLDFTSVE